MFIALLCIFPYHAYDTVENNRISIFSYSLAHSKPSMCYTAWKA